MRRTKMIAGLAAGTMALSVAPAHAGPATAARPTGHLDGSLSTSDTDRAYTPTRRVLLNDPMAPKRVWIQQDEIIRAIRSTPKGQRIRISTWNFDSKNGSYALVDAARRGVSVQVTVDGITANPNFTRLQRGLKKYSRGTKDSQKSYARKCVSSCRGRTGLSHTKMYLFSKAGDARDVVMFGSVNFTAAAAVNQWNDLIVQPNSPELYRQYDEIFNQMKWDKKANPMWRVFGTSTGVFRSFFFPATYIKPEPITRHFDKISCRGVGAGYGVNGRTKIRIAIAGWFDQYGGRVAQAVRRLWDRGCDIKVVNTLTGRSINQQIHAGYGRGPIPTKEVTTPDWDGNGAPDNYIHLKYFTVDGVYEGNRTTRAVFTGSANWTQRSVNSDELFVRVRRPGWTKYYADHVDRLFRSPWAHRRTWTPEQLVAGRSGAERLKETRGIDISDHIEQDW